MMTALFYVIMTLFIAFFVYTTASQVRMILAALTSNEVQKTYQNENDGYAVVRTTKAA